MINSNNNNFCEDDWYAMERSINEPYESGANCPRYKLMLFEFAKAVGLGRELSPEETEIQDHIDKCGACRLIVDGALLELHRMVPASLVGEEGMKSGIAADLVMTINNMLDRLRNAQKQIGYLPLGLADYVGELAKAASIQEGNLIRALDLPRDTGILSMNNLESMVWKSVSEKLGLDKQFAHLSAKWASCQNDTPLELAARMDVMEVEKAASAEEVCKILETWIKESEDI